MTAKLSASGGMFSCCCREGGGNAGLAEPEASVLEHTESSSSADTSGASLCAPCAGVSSFGCDATSAECQADFQIPLCAASSEVMISYSPASATQFTSPVTPYSLLAVHASVRQTGEANYEAESSETRERRPHASTDENFPAHNCAVTSDIAVTTSPVTTIEPSKDTATTAPSALSLRAASSHGRLGWWHPLAYSPVAGTQSPVDGWEQSQRGESPIHRPRGEGDMCTFRNNTCSVISAVASTAATTPRAAPGAPSRTAGALFFSKTLSTAQAHTGTDLKETKTALQTPVSDNTSAVASTRSSLPDLPGVPAPEASFQWQCDRSGHQFPATPTAREGLSYRSRADAPVAQQQSTSLTAVMNSESKPPIELFARWPGQLAQAATPLLLLDTSTDAAFVVGCARRRVHPTGVAGCLQTAHSGSCGCSQMHNNTVLDTGTLDDDSSSKVCRLRSNGNTCTNAWTWAPPGEQNGTSSHILERDVSTHALGDVAGEMPNGNEDGIVDDLREHTEHLEKVESTARTRVIAGNLCGLKDAVPNDNSSATGVLKANSVFRGGEQRKTCRTDGIHGRQYSAEPTEEEKSSLFQSPCTSSLTACGKIGTLEAAATRRKSLLTAKHAATRWCPNSPTASPQAYRSYSTPNFGLRLAASPVAFPDTNAASTASPREWRKNGVIGDNDKIIDHIGCLLPTDFCRTQQPPPQEQAQQLEEETPQQEEKKEHNVLQQKSWRRSIEEEQLPANAGALSGKKLGRLTSHRLLLCGSAAAGAESSRAACSHLADLLVDDSSRAHGAGEQSREAFDHNHSDDIPPDFSERVPAQQQGRLAQPGEEFCLPVLQVEAFYNQLYSLGSSRSSSDLNNSNGNCCCTAKHTDVAPQNQHHSSPRSTACTARHQSLTETCRTIQKPDTATATGRELYAVNDNAPSAGGASSVKFRSSQKDKANWLQKFDPERLERQYRLQLCALHEKTAEEQTSDGAEADAESNCASADEAGDYVFTGEGNGQDEEMRHQQSLDMNLILKTGGSRRSKVTRDAGGSIQFKKAENGGGLLHAAPLRVASFSKKTTRNSEDDGATAMQADTVFVTLDESAFSPKTLERTSGELIPDQPNATTLSWADQTGEVAPEVQTSWSASAGTAKRTLQKTEEIQQRMEAEGSECKSSFSEQHQQMQKDGGDDSKESVVREKRVLHHQSLSRKEKRGREQHPQQREGQLRVNASAGELCCRRGLQQLSRTGDAHVVSSCFLEETAYRNLVPHREITITALLDEFLETAS